MGPNQIFGMIDGRLAIVTQLKPSSNKKTDFDTETRNAARSRQRSLSLFSLDRYSMRVIAVSILLASIFSGVPSPLFAAPTSSVQYARIFAIGGIGWGGGMSEGEGALRVILASPDATKRLESMLPAASDAGQLYIVLGLRTCDRSAYHRALALCSTDRGEVETMRGCIVLHESFRSLVRRIDRGEFDRLIKSRWYLERDLTNRRSEPRKRSGLYAPLLR